MMQLIRDKAQGIFVWLIVAFIIIAFATFGLGSYLSGSANVAVAVVNGDEILVTQYDRAYQNFQQRLQQQQGESYRPDMFPESFVRQQVIDSLVTDLLFDQYLQKQNFSASAGQVQSELVKQTVFNGDNNKFSVARYREVLDQQSINVVSYENSVKKQIVQQQLYTGIQDSTFVLNAEVEQFEKLKNQQRDVGVLRLSLAKFKNDVKISDDDIEAYYKTHSVEFMTPDMVSVEYVELDLDKIAQNFTITDDEAKKYYENNIKLYSTGTEQRKIRHILISVNKKTDDESAKKQITALYGKIIAGADFTEVAKKSSQDVGSAKQGGDLGLVSKGDNDKSFDEVAFALTKNQVSKPVRSRFGYHLIKVDEIKSAKIAALNEVKDKIKKELKKNKAEDGFYKDVDRMDQIAYETSGSLGPMKDELNLDIKTSNLFTRSGGGGVIFSDRRVLEQVFSDDVLNQARNSAPIELSESHYVVVRLAKREPAKQKPLENVKAVIKSRLLTEKANTLISKSAKEAADKLSKGVVGDKIVSDIQYTKWTRYGNINRIQATAADKDTIDPVTRKKAFSLPRPGNAPTIETITIAGGDKSVVVVFAVKEKDKIKNTKPDLNNQQRGLTAAISNTELDAFIAFIKEQADIKIIKQSAE
jgi:peptidyl-prolyl cis-trans isomerase D